MKAGDRVKIVTMDGTTKPRNVRDHAENYWKLLGEAGTIKQDPREKNLYAHFSVEPRVLVKFDKDIIMAYGLYSHNSIKNSLWILVSDLELFEER